MKVNILPPCHQCPEGWEGVGLCGCAESTPQVTPQVKRLLSVIKGEMSRTGDSEPAGLIKDKWIEMRP